MRGIIGFTQLKIPCVVGVHPSERLKEQDLFVDLSVKVPMDACAKKDSLEKTVDYSLLANAISKLAVLRKYKLLETFAVEALALIFKKWPQVSWAKIHIYKPSAIPGAHNAFVFLERKRK
jgi:dihydroneopterin aldolase